MVRKTAYGLAAAATMAIALLAPIAASAKADVSFHFGVYGGGFYPGFYPGFYAGAGFPMLYPGVVVKTCGKKPVLFQGTHGVYWKLVKVC